MALTLIDREINKIHVIDDDTDSREGYGLTVEEMDVEPVLQNERVENIDGFLQTMDSHDAVVSDHHLKKSSSYFPTNGADFIARCYEKHIPSVLTCPSRQAGIFPPEIAPATSR